MITISFVPVRSDTLPENTNYRDDGCEFAKSCLDCELPACKFDAPGWMRKADRHERDQAVVRARTEEDMAVPDIAARFNVSTRTIHRILQSERTGELAREQIVPQLRPEQLRIRRFFKSPEPLPAMRAPSTRMKESVVFEVAAGF